MRTGLRQSRLHTRNAQLAQQWKHEAREDSPRSRAYDQLFEEARQRVAQEAAKRSVK